MQGMLARLERAGATKGAPVVLLHGFGGQAAQWRPIMRALAAEQRRSIAFDLPGHAGSLAYSGPAHARGATAAVLAELDGVARFHLCGHSFGGAVAALVALSAPERVASVTYLAPGGFGPEINAAALRGFAEARGVKGLAAALQSFFADSFARPQAMLRAMARMRAIDGQNAALAALALRFLNTDGTQGVLPMDRIDALPMRKCVVWGQDDRIMPAGQGMALSQARVITLPGVGHMLSDEAPGVVADVLRAQIASGD
jgi:pimeloyl-ACP methyl ester carboxylesterase